MPVRGKKRAAQLDREIREALANPRSARDRLFIGTYPTGIVYADRAREIRGDYLRLATLPFRTLEIEWAAVSMPEELRELIRADAKTLQDRRGELYQVSTAGQTVRLGG